MQTPAIISFCPIQYLDRLSYNSIGCRDRFGWQVGLPIMRCSRSERFSVRWQRGGPASQAKLRGASTSGPATSPMPIETTSESRGQTSHDNLSRSRSSPPEHDAQQPQQQQHLRQSLPDYSASAFSPPGLNGIKRSSSFDGRTSRPAFVDGERLLATEGDAYWVEGLEEPGNNTGLKVRPALRTWA